MIADHFVDIQTAPYIMPLLVFHYKLFTIIQYAIFNFSTVNFSLLTFSFSLLVFNF